MLRYLAEWISKHSLVYEIATQTANNERSQKSILWADVSYKNPEFKTQS